MSNANIKWAQDAIEAKKAKMLENQAENRRLEAEIPDLEAYIRVEKAKAGAPNAPVTVPLTTVVAKVAEAASPLMQRLLEQKRGAKKRALLTALTTVHAAETGWLVAAMKFYKIEGATQENTSPQLSAYKADGLVDLSPNGWSITQKGRDYLAQKN